MPDPIAATNALPVSEPARTHATGAAKGEARKGESANEEPLKSKALVAFLGLLGAAVAPLTTYMYKQSELALENLKVRNEVERNRRQQNHDIRLTYFDKALDRTKDDGYRESVLSFLSLSSEDDHLAQWARTENQRLSERRNQIAAELLAKRRDADGLKSRISNLEAALKANQGTRASESERLKLELQALLEKRREGEQSLLALQKEHKAEDEQRRLACQTKCETTQATCVSSCENLYEGKRRETCQHLCGAELGSCTGGC